MRERLDINLPMGSKVFLSFFMSEVTIPIKRRMEHLGSFFALYGRTKSVQLIDDALAGKLVGLAGQG